MVRLPRLAGLAGSGDRHLRDLLAIRMARGALLLECADDSARRAFAVQRAWQNAASALRDASRRCWWMVCALALELAYQRDLAARLQQAEGVADVLGTSGTGGVLHRCPQ